MEQVLYGMFAFNPIAGLDRRRLLDFLTSPEVGPLFREFVENVIDENWIDLAVTTSQLEDVWTSCPCSLKGLKMNLN